MSNIKLYPSARAYRNAAHRLFQTPMGEITIEANAKVERTYAAPCLAGQEKGAYVQVWLWVDRDDVSKLDEEEKCLASSRRT